MAENEYIKQIYKSRNILLDILKERGFNTDDFSGFSISEIHAMYQNKQLDILLSKPLEETGKEKEKREAYMKANKERGIRAEKQRDYELFGTTEQNIPKVDAMGNVTGMKKGGKVSSASKRADGCCIKGKTRA